MTNNKHLIIIAGPTAIGKTDLSINLALDLKTEIISCDSRQIYKELNIGTAKPTFEELNKVKHHFIDHRSIHEEYNVGKFEQEALVVLDELFKKKDVVIMTGGTGLYIDALCFGLDNFPRVPEDAKEKWNNIFKEKGLIYLQNLLQEQDPTYYQEVDLNNHSRLIRALSLMEVTKKPFSSFRKKTVKQRSFNLHFIKLERERPELYERINLRVDLMMKAGQLEEVKSLSEYKHLNALQTVGYKELFSYLANEITLPRAIELIKQNSRRYAKRQMTWLRKDYYESFHPESYGEIKKYIELIVSD